MYYYGYFRDSVRSTGFCPQRRRVLRKNNHRQGMRFMSNNLQTDVPQTEGVLRSDECCSRRYLAAKRALDVVCSFSALVLLGPVILVLALAIFLDDPHGSPFFSQTRIGLNGRPFRFYKLRSMVCNAEELRQSLQDQNEMDGPAFKIRNDPRITRIGRFIRRTSLDELPQFWNVLKGDMSMVGPRPPLPAEVASYTPYQRQRLTVKPGLTCIWQTMPRRNELPFRQWVELDLEYIRTRNMRLDLKLIFKTVGCMFAGEGR